MPEVREALRHRGNAGRPHHTVGEGWQDDRRELPDAVCGLQPPQKRRLSRINNACKQAKSKTGFQALFAHRVQSDIRRVPTRPGDGGRRHERPPFGEDSPLRFRGSRVRLCAHERGGAGRVGVSRLRRLVCDEHGLHAAEREHLLRQAVA